FRVTAYNAAGESAPSSTATVTTPAPPAPPSNLAATASSGSRVDLTWADNASNEDGFKVYYSSGGASYTVLATAAANPTASTSPRPAPTTFCSSRVTASNAAGESAPSNTATVTTPAPPAAPSNLAAAAAASGSRVDLTWADNASNEDGFKVYYSSGGASYTVLATAAANATAYTWTRAAPGTTYSFRVTAYNAAGESAPSNTPTVTTPAPPAAPGHLAATAARS